MIRTLTATLLLIAACACSSSSKEHTMQPNPHLGQVRHVVLFKFKPGTPTEKIRQVERAFADLPRQIPQIVAFEYGTNISPEGKDLGYTHCFLVTFRDPAGRDAYLPHPAHERFKKLVGPLLAEVHVIDYVPRQD